MPMESWAAKISRETRRSGSRNHIILSTWTNAFAFVPDVQLASLVCLRARMAVASATHTSFFPNTQVTTRWWPECVLLFWRPSWRTRVRAAVCLYVAQTTRASVLTLAQSSSAEAVHSIETIWIQQRIELFGTVAGCAEWNKMRWFCNARDKLQNE